jgi:HK97 family phage major capsid protein
MAKHDLETGFRYCELELTKIDRAARTIPISFSSEWPALQKATPGIAKMTGLTEGQVFVEVLDHALESVDLSIINNRGAFLDEHDEKDQLGVIEKAEITGEKRGLALVKIGKDEHAEKRFAQMEGGIRTHISSGYRRTKFLGKEKLPNGRDAYRFAWKPTEISSVAVPADPTVGVGMGVARAYQDLPEIDSPKIVETKVSPEPKIIMDENIAEPTEAQRKIIADGALKSDLARRSAIRTAADKVIEKSPTMKDAIRKIAEDCDLAGETVGDFSTKALEAFGARKLDHTEAHIGMEQKEIESFSITRAIQSCMNSKTGKIEKDCPEFEYNEECEKRYGKRSSSFWIPADVVVNRKGADREKGRRDMQVNIFGQGGAFVPTLLEPNPIELLRNKMVLAQLGIRIMGGLTGNVAIPRQTGAATAYSLSEIAQAAVSNQVIDQILLTPHRVSAVGIYSKQLLIQSAIAIENFMRDDLMTVNALRLDYLGWNGAGGSSEPLGIINTPAVGSVTFGAAATYAKLVAFETAINVANSTGGSRAYVTTPTAKGVLKSAAKLLVGATTVAAVALWEDDEINGYRAEDTNQILNNGMIFGNFNSLIMALFGGLDIVVDPYTLADKAEVKITINNFVDFALRHPQEFVVSADAANQ